MATRKRNKTVTLKPNQAVIELGTAKIARGVATIYKTKEIGRLIIDFRTMEGSDIVEIEDEEE